jgi:hypothetical protein
MHTVAAPGRWVWGLSGLVTIAALAIPGAFLITYAGVSSPRDVAPQTAVTRTETVPQPVTGLILQSYGGPVQVTAGPVRRVKVTETITYIPGDAKPPAVTQSVSGGRLTLTDPACEVSDCSVGFTVTVPPDVAVTAASQGGPVVVSGVAGANVESGGGAVSATRIDGPLTVTSEGGPLLVNGLTGRLNADTGGGALIAQDITATTVTVVTGGGEARIVFAAAPDTVVVSTDGGPAMLGLPGGPYALTADSSGGPQVLGIPTEAAAHRSIMISTGGGPLQIEPTR